jgi:hypothetical protein
VTKRPDSLETVRLALELLRRIPRNGKIDSTQLHKQRIEAEAGNYLLETPLSQDQQVTEHDDGTLEITATVVDSAMLEWWLRGFGKAISQIHREPKP